MSAVICLGLPLKSIISKTDKLFGNLKNVSVQFIIGSNSRWCSFSDIEKLRRQRNGLLAGVSTLLYIVPGANDGLQVEYKFMRMGLTQEACDQRICIEIGMFISD